MIKLNRNIFRTIKKLVLQKISLVIFLFLLSIAGSINIYYAWKSSNDETSREAIKEAKMIEYALGGGDGMLKQLHALPGDTGKIEYKDLKKRLNKIINIQKNARFIYIYTQRAGKLFFIIDSEPSNSKDCSPAGQAYSEADDEYKKPFLSGMPLITKPATDRWGTWVSILIPIKNNDSGETVSVLAVDYPASRWHNAAIVHTLLAAGVVFIIFILVIAFYVVYNKNLVLKESAAENKRVEEYLMQLNIQLKGLNATKDKLFAIVAHDLRSPFVSILGLLELLENNIRSYDIETSVDFIKQTNSSAKLTFSLLDNLLLWAKTQTQQIEFKPENIPLTPVFKSIIELYKPSAELKNITLNYSHHTDIEVYADKDMLYAILRNLIYNAIKFTNPGGIVDVSASSKQGRIEFIIADNGVGMNDETKMKLFKIEKNETTRGTEGEKGSGLGLILCQEFIEKHGGEIWAESILGEGSKFFFTISPAVAS
jgi:signal transduction histidine kinase